jgi:hypothetical protein
LATAAKIGIDLLFEQAALLGGMALGLCGELHALQERVLVGQLLVQGTLMAQLRQKSGGHLAQLFCAQFGQGLRLHHHEP